jgi:hypothetical protein
MAFVDRDAHHVVIRGVVFILIIYIGGQPFMKFLWPLVKHEEEEEARVKKIWIANSLLIGA